MPLMFDDIPNDSGAPQASAPQSQALPQAQAQAQIQGQSQSNKPLMFDDIPAEGQASTSADESTPGEGLVAGLEGAGRGILGPLAPLAERHLFNVPYSDIKNREERHPVASGVGEAAGLIGGAMAGVGEGAAMESAGKLGAEALGLAQPATYAAKVGSAAVRGAIEGAVLQSSDETSRMVISPETADLSAQSALANVGMAAAFGGGAGAFITGAVSPLWKATIGTKLEGVLTDIQGKLGGVDKPEGKTSVKDLENAIGTTFDPSVRGVIDGSPIAQYNASRLNQTDTVMAGRKFQDIIRSTTDDLGDKAAETLGKEPSFLEDVKRPDKYETGRSITEGIHDDLKPEVDAVNSRYEAIKAPLQQTIVTQPEKQMISDQVAQKAIAEGWHKSANDANMNLVSKVLDKLPQQQTVQDFDKFISNLQKDNQWGSESYQAAKSIRDIMRQAQEAVISSRLSPEVLTEYQGTRAAYKSLMDKIDSIDQHISVGKWEGPQTFLDALKEKGESSGEQMLSRLSGKNKANVLEVLQQFPTALNRVKDYHVNELLGDAAIQARSQNLGIKVNTSRLMKNFREMSPQLQSLIANPEQQAKLEAIDTAMNRLKDPTHNWSNTARTVDKHMSSAASPMSMVMELLAEHAYGVPLLGFIARSGLSEGIAAGRLSMLKYLGSNKAVDGTAFKSMAQLISNSYKFGNMVTKAVDNVMKPGAQVILAKSMPTQKERDKLDSMVAKSKDDPNVVAQLTNSKVGHYMPEHQVGLSSAVTNNMQYLAQLKPHPQFISPLDKTMPVDPIAQARYNRALDIANNPAIVLQHIKDGTLKVTDIQDLKTMYPAVYQGIVQKVSNSMAENRGSIPYKTRIGLSLLVGQPVDSSMSPNAIRSAQPLPKSPQSPQPTTKNKKGTSSLGKSNKQYMTPGQASEEDRSSRD